MATLRLVPSSGSTIEITAAETMVGREPGCDVLLSDGSVSRKHAKIERRGHIWAVVDQGSANGTYVDSQKIGEAVLKNGQEVRFGTVSFRVDIPPDELEVTVAGTLPEATVMAPTGGPAAPMPSGPPPIPKGASAPPPPPSAAAAKERFRGGASPSSGPVPQMPAPPPQKGRGPLFWMSTGCCGCLVLVLLFAVSLGGGLYFLTQGAADAVHTTLRQIRGGDLDGAYEGLAPSYRAQMSREEFEALVERHPGLKNNAEATFWNRSVANDRATLTGVLTPEGGAPERVVIELRKDGGTWKISQIRFEDPQEGSCRRDPLSTAT